MTLSLFGPTIVGGKLNSAGAMPSWWPVCTACGRPIERMSWTCDPAPPPRTRFRVDSHGMTASVIVPRHQAASGALLCEVPKP